MVVALVTGAGRGLGLEFAKQLLEEGATVYAGVRAPERAGALAELKKRFPDKVHPIQLDVADLHSIRQVQNQLTELQLPLDLLLNNAGINAKGVEEAQRNTKLGELEPTGLERMLRVNALGPLLLTQQLLTNLQRSEQARVIHISSWLGALSQKSRGGNYGYCGSKAALNMFGRCLAFDLLEYNIISAMFNPGWVQTAMGGPKAELTPEQSVSHILRTARSLTLEQAGCFLNHDGTIHPW